MMLLNDEHVKGYTAMLESAIATVGSTSTFAKGISPRIHNHLETHRRNAFQCALDEWTKIVNKCQDCAFGKGCGGQCLARGGVTFEDARFFAHRLKRHTRENWNTHAIHADLLASECARMSAEAWQHARNMFGLVFTEIALGKAAAA